MENSTTVGVIREEKVILKLTYGKTLSLSNVWYVPSLRKNLVSESLLNQAGHKFVMEDEKVVLTKNREFVDKGYMSNGMLVLNTISMNPNIFGFAFIVESIDLWHGRLGHVIMKLEDLRLSKALFA